MDDLENVGFPVSAWNDSVNGYGLRMSIRSREKYFSKKWNFVLLQLPAEEIPIKITLSASFWNKCCELRSVEIRHWLFDNKFVPWEKGNPPKFLLVNRKDNYFQLKEAL
jgi:hypothetical protein